MWDPMLSQGLRAGSTPVAEPDTRSSRFPQGLPLSAGKEHQQTDNTTGGGGDAPSQTSTIPSKPTPFTTTSSSNIDGSPFKQPYGGGQAPQKQPVVGSSSTSSSNAPVGLDQVPKEIQAVSFYTPTKEYTVYSKLLTNLGANGPVPSLSGSSNSEIHPTTTPANLGEPKHQIRDLPRFRQVVGLNPSGDGDPVSARFGHIEQDHIRDKGYSLGATFNERPGLNLKNAEAFYEWLAVVVLPSLKALFENDLETLRMRNRKMKETGRPYDPETTFTEKFFAQIPLKQQQQRQDGEQSPHPLKGNPVSRSTQETLVTALVVQMFPDSLEEGAAPMPLGGKGSTIELQGGSESAVKELNEKDSFLAVDLREYTKYLSKLEYNFYRGKSDRGSGALKNTELAKRLCELGNSSNMHRKPAHYSPSACSTQQQQASSTTKADKWPDNLSPISILPWFCPPSRERQSDPSSSSTPDESTTPPEPLCFEEYLACLSVFPKNAPRLWNTLATMICLFLGSMKVVPSSLQQSNDGHAVMISSLEETCCDLVNASLDYNEKEDDEDEDEEILLSRSSSSPLPIAPGAAIFLLHFALEASTHANVEHGASSSSTTSSGMSSSTAGVSSTNTASTHSGSDPSFPLSSDSRAVTSSSSSSSAPQDRFHHINKMQEQLGPTTKKKAMAVMVMRIMILLEETSKELADLRLERERQQHHVNGDIAEPQRYKSSWLSWVRHYILSSQARVRDAMGQFDKAAAFHWTNFTHLRGLDTQIDLKHFQQLGQKLLQQLDIDQDEKKKGEQSTAASSDDVKKRLPHSKLHLLVSAKRETSEVISSYPSLRKDVFTNDDDPVMMVGAKYQQQDQGAAVLLQRERYHLSLPEQQEGNMALLTASITPQHRLSIRTPLSSLISKAAMLRSQQQLAGGGDLVAASRLLLEASFLPLTPLMIESAFRLHQYFKVPSQSDEAIRKGGSYPHFLIDNQGRSETPPPHLQTSLLTGHPTQEELELVKFTVGDWLDTHGDMSKSFSHVTFDSSPEGFEKFHLGYNESYVVAVEIAFRYFKEVHTNHASERSAMNTIIQEYCDGPNNDNITRGPVKDFLRAERDRMNRLLHFVYAK